MLNIIQLIFKFTADLWLFSGIYIVITRLFGKTPYEFIRTIFHELKPFYVPSVIMYHVIEATERTFNFWDYILLAINLWFYWAYKDVDKDDRWKRRKEKLAEKVAQVGSKLAIVPAQ